MTVGYDVCHDPSDRRRSYGAMVASLDKQCTRWYSNVTHHSAGEELSINFASNMLSKLILAVELGVLNDLSVLTKIITLLRCVYTEAIKRYKETNRSNLPKIILIFRDGVGDGQIEHVLNQEVEQIKVSESSYA